MVHARQAKPVGKEHQRLRVYLWVWLQLDHRPRGPSVEASRDTEVERRSTRLSKLRNSCNEVFV